MLREHDVIRLARDLHGLKQGTLGAVVLVYGGGEAFEVELVDEEGHTLDVISVLPEDLVPVREQPAYEARPTTTMASLTTTSYEIKPRSDVPRPRLAFAA